MTAIVVTGATGFVGNVLIRKLLGNGEADIVGTTRHSPPPDSDKVRYRHLDLTDHDAVDALVREVAPQQVYHLAALSAPGQARDNRDVAWADNVTAGELLLGALTRYAADAKILYTSSSEVYGRVDPALLPLHEDSPCRPEGFYGQTKLRMEQICRRYVDEKKLSIVIARPFNHTGPGQDERFFAPAFAMQIARIEAGLLAPVIRTGSLDAKRDICDVRDVVRAYVALMADGEPGETYQICSGRARPISDALDILMGRSTCSDLSHELDPDRMRPSENPIFFGSADKIYNLTGWQCSISLEETLADLLELCRQQVNSGRSL